MVDLNYKSKNPSERDPWMGVDFAQHHRFTVMPGSLKWINELGVEVVINTWGVENMVNMGDDFDDG